MATYRTILAPSTAPLSATGCSTSSTGTRNATHSEPYPAQPRLPWANSAPVLPDCSLFSSGGVSFQPACIILADSFPLAICNPTAFAQHHMIPLDAQPVFIGGITFKSLINGDHGDPITPSEATFYDNCQSGISRFSLDWPRLSTAWRSLDSATPRGAEYLAQAQAEQTAQWWQGRLARLLVFNMKHEISYVQHVSPDAGEGAAPPLRRRPRRHPRKLSEGRRGTGS